MHGTDSLVPVTNWSRQWGLAGENDSTIKLPNQ